MNLNISITNIFKYWDALIQHTNPLAIITTAIIGGIVGFAILLIAEIILRKKILIRRRHWSLKYLAYAYMIFFPLFGGFCFSQWFALHRCQQELVKNIPTYLGEVNSIFNTYLKDEVVKVIDERYLQLSGREAIGKAVEVGGKVVSAQLKENVTTKDTLTASAISFLLRKVSDTEAVKEIAVSCIEEKLGETIMMDKDMTGELLNVKVGNILEDGILNTIIEKHIKNIFGGFKMNVILILLIGLAIPSAEIVLAHYLERKRKKTEMAMIQNNVTPTQSTDNKNQQNNKEII